MADQHSKRLKLAKSTRIVLGNEVKPPRIQKHQTPEIDLNLSNSKKLQTGQKKALLPQSLRVGAKDSEAGPGEERQPYQQPFHVPPVRNQTSNQQSPSSNNFVKRQSTVETKATSQFEAEAMPEQTAPRATDIIAQNHAVNDAFIDNIRAKLDMLEQF